MRRIPMTLALLATATLAGCMVGTKSSSPTGSDAQKGVTGQYFFVNINQPPLGGTITSDAGGIACGASAVTVNNAVSPPQYAYTYISSSCGVNGQTRFPWFQADGTTPTTVTLTATPDPGKAFIGWAGDCSGTATTCTLTSGADKTVVAVFGAPGSGHGSPFPGTVHGPALLGGTLDCFACHGNVGQGKSIAPACSTCHAELNRSASGLQFAVTSITATATNIVVAFTVKDDAGANVDLTGADGKNRPFVPRFGLASFSRDPATGIVGPYLVRTAGDGGPGVLTPPAVGAPASPTTGELTGTPGNYTYTFPSVVTFDPARSADTHTLWIQGTRQENLTTDATRTRSVRNHQFNFIPGAVGVPVTAAVPERREVVAAAACAGCHDGFRPKGVLTGGVFHGGGRVDGTYCAVCHNPANTRGEPATADEGRRAGLWTGTAAQFVHSLHASVEMGLPASALFFGKSAATYPQPAANCVACHAAGAAQGAQWKTRPTVEACGSCHPAYPYPHNVNSTGACEGCHTPDGIEYAHVPYVRRDPNNSLETAGGNTRTNAAMLTGAGQVIPGASKISAVIRDVSTSPTGRPVISFKLRKSDQVYAWAPGGGGYSTVTTDVVFNAPPAVPDASKEIMNDFVGTVGVYVVFSLPQDGIATPADFNVSVNSNVKLAWMNVGGTGADVTTLSGPDVDGFYAITFPNLVIPSNASNLTAGIGYAYSLPGTQPLTQVSVNGSPWSAFTPFQAFPATITSGTLFGQDCSITPCPVTYGGALAPIQNVWKAAGTPRRAIVDNGKCNGCHAVLGVGPTFHVGQRNDAPSCSFCHNPNQNKLGWSSNASTFVHAIHGGGKRTVDYGWTASCPVGSTWNVATAQCEDAAHAKVNAGFAEVEYPQSPAKCGACHTDGTDSYAFEGVRVADLLWTTVASGTMGTTTAPAQSPYVELGKNYGAKFSVTMGASGGAPVVTPAASTTLVTSPVTAACFSCHDDAGARTHMTAMGGTLYQPRSAVSTTLDVETCLGCHGVGRVFDVVLMHR